VCRLGGAVAIRQPRPPKPRPKPVGFTPPGETDREQNGSTRAIQKLTIQNEEEPSYLSGEETLLKRKGNTSETKSARSRGRVFRVEKKISCLQERDASSDPRPEDAPEGGAQRTGHAFYEGTLEGGGAASAVMSRSGLRRWHEDLWRCERSHEQAGLRQS
jgi:hypothetical protein